MRLRSSSRYWRLVAAFLPFPLVGLGYFAIQPGSAVAFRLEVLMSGKGSEHARLQLRGTLDGEPLTVPVEALHLFATPAKGPRADHYLSLQKANIVVKPTLAAVVPASLAPAAIPQVIVTHAALPASIPPEDHTVTAALPAPALVVSGTGKGDRLMMQTSLAKADAAPVVAEAADHLSAALFFATSDNPLASFQADDTPAAASTGAAPEKAVKLAAYVPSDLAKNLKYQGESEAEYQERERRCLATAIYFEARGEPLKGQQAVAQVVMNRVRSPDFPDTICGVVYQGQFQKAGCQFSFACDGIADVPRDAVQWAQAVRLAKQTTEGKVWLPEIGYSSYYHATYVRPDWVGMMTKIERIGRHVFYKPRNDKPYVVQEASTPAAPSVISGGAQAPASPAPSLAFGPSG